MTELSNPGNRVQLRRALALAERGFYVFPLRTQGDLKAPHPMLGAGGESGGHRGATLDRGVIREWWTRVPEAGIGINLARSGLLAVDVDRRDGGHMTLAKYEAENSVLRSCVEVRSGSGDGSKHIYFRVPVGRGGRVPGRIGAGRGEGESGVQIKHNGYVVAAGSPHPSGGVYEYLRGRSALDLLDVAEIPEAPAWVLSSANPHAVTGDGGMALMSWGQEIDGVIMPMKPRTGQPTSKLAERVMLVPNGGLSNGVREAEQEYDDWFRVISAIHYETEGSDEGEGIALTWSVQSSRHTVEKFEKAWESLGKTYTGEPVTFASIEYMIADGERQRRSALIDQALTVFALRKPTEERLREVAAQLKTITGGNGVTAVDRAIWAAKLSAAFKRAGASIPVTACRAMIRPEREVMDAPDWLDPWVYLAQDDLFYNKRTRAAITTKAFNARFSREMLTEQDRKEGLAHPSVQPADFALNVVQVQTYESRLYMPSSEPGDDVEFNGMRFINSYSGGGAAVPVPRQYWSAADADAVARVQAHVETLIPDRREAALFLSVFAWVLKTKQRVGWATVLQSAEGAGKSFFAVLMRKLLGRGNVGEVAPRELQKEFSGWAEGNLLTFMEELQVGFGKYEAMNSLKPFITNQTVLVRRMRMDTYEAPNTTTYVAFTNHQGALPLDEKDRRYFVIYSAIQTREDAMELARRENGRYFARLFRTVENHAGALAGWLREYELHEEFNAWGRAPMTPHKLAMIEASKGDEQIMIEDILSDGGAGCDWTLASSLRVVEAIAARDGGAWIKTRSVNRLMRDAGLIYLGRHAMPGSEHKERWWSKTPARFYNERRAVLWNKVRDYYEESDL